MRKSLDSGAKLVPGTVFLSLLAGATLMLAAADKPVNAMSKILVQRAKNELARIEPLVADGTLPKTALDEAKAKLADAEDQEILSETLYGELNLENLTEGQAIDMVAAAERRVDRQTKIVQDREKLLDSGIIARSDLQALQDELQGREKVLELAKNRVQLLHELAQMAEAERRLEHDAQTMAGSDLQNVMIRFGGNGLFSLSDLPTISTEFEKRFHSALPVSARGQTLVHQWMGLDHRNRVDVALNPDSPEGVWLRQLLERVKIPYLAFRAAVAGAATAPHIHIGPESTRLRLASR